MYFSLRDEKLVAIDRQSKSTGNQFLGQLCSSGQTIWLWHQKRQIIWLSIIFADNLNDSHYSCEELLKIELNFYSEHWIKLENVQDGYPLYAIHCNKGFGLKNEGNEGNPF